MTVVLSLVAAATGLLCCWIIIIMKIKALIIVIFVAKLAKLASYVNVNVAPPRGDIPPPPPPVVVK